MIQGIQDNINGNYTAITDLLNNEIAQKLFTKMYEQAGAAAGAGPQAGPTPEAGPAPEGFNGDDVVDGDYKEV